MKRKDCIKRVLSISIIIIFAFIMMPIGLLFVPKVNAEKFISHGKMENSVVFVSFLNEEVGDKKDNFPENFYDDIYNMYEIAPSSVRKYIDYQSNGKLDFTTRMIFDNSECVKIDKDASYFKPKFRWANGGYEIINPIGYDNRYYDFNGSVTAPDAKGAKVNIEGALREQLLIRDVVESLDLPNNFDGDGNDDGVIDSLVIITDMLDLSDWGSICWSHMGIVHNFEDNVIGNYYYDLLKKDKYQNIKNVYLGKKEVIPYNIIPLGAIIKRKASDCKWVVDDENHTLYDVGLLCHEILHTIGFYDYYSYEDNDYQAVGEFDIMANHSKLPQNMLEYMRYKAGWIGYDDILYINDSGTYTVYPQISSKGKKVAKIVLSDYLETGEYFMFEARSSSLATKEIPFDGDLSGYTINGGGDKSTKADGLIMYRVNENASYINANGEMSSTEYGNMYGVDEVYIYRIGNGKSTNSRDTLVNYSLAMFGGMKNLYSGGNLYDMTTFGTKAEKSAMDLVMSKNNPSETMLFYSNLKNSKIVISDIKQNSVDGSVTFNVDLPEKQGTMPVLNSDAVSISRYLNGKNRLYWKTDVKSGKAHVLVIRSTNRLKKLAEIGKTHITIDDFKNGEFSNYKTLYKAEIPMAEKWAELPEFDDEALVFIALEPENDNRAVRYVGCLTVENETFGQYFLKILDPLYLITGTISIVVITLLFIALATSVKARRRNRIMRK